MYAIVQVDSPNYGSIISRHRTYERADAVWSAAVARLRRQPGQQGSWLPWSIVALHGLGQHTATRVRLSDGWCV